jgi:hypothetical protein
MSYPYPIPGVAGGVGPQPDNYFFVGNECCGGYIAKDAVAIIKVFFDYTSELPSGVNVSAVSYSVTPLVFGGLVLTGEQTSANISSFMAGAGVVGAQYVVEALAQLSDGQTWVDHITISVKDCLPPPAAPGPSPVYGPGPVYIASTLYYTATAQQTVFPLSTPDRFGQTGTIAGNNVFVYANGSRLVPGDAYTVDSANNRIIMVWPAGAGESIAVDLVALPVPPELTNALKMEYLPITVANSIPNTTYPPDGNMTILFVNGTAFFPIGPQAAFTVFGNALTWTSTLYSIPAGAAVIAVYTHA